jgi:myo-inositol-1(or 4)-monophosphatase
LIIKENDLFHYLKIAKKAALISGKFLQKNYKKIYKIEEKGIRDVVTEIDKKSEKLLKEYFLKKTPKINFFGEESGGIIHDLSWVVDPLDGTKNYIHKIPYFGVSIALCLDLIPVVGVVYFPLINKLYWAVTDFGAFLKIDNKVLKLKVSKTDNISQSFLATGFPHSKSHLVSNYIVELEYILKKVSAVRRLGSASYDLCCVADGTFDAFWEYGLESWDMAAAALIAKEAGAHLSTTSGKDWNVKSDSIFVSNQALANQILDIIKSSHL